MEAKVKTPTISGGDGLTKENPVIIHADESFSGITAEYGYITGIHGPHEGQWGLKQQRLLKTENGHMDHLTIAFKDGSTKDYFFDITEFFGKY